MNSRKFTCSEKTACHSTGAIRLTALTLALAGCAVAQPVAASIETTSGHVRGSALFDAARNSYYLPPGPSFVQRASDGSCLLATGFIGSVATACPDAEVHKFGPAGNLLWSALMGGPFPDTASALAIDSNGNVLFTGSSDGKFPATPGSAIGITQATSVFAAKLSSDGKVLYATNLPDFVVATSSVTSDAAGNAYIAGTTSTGHAVAVKVSADGSMIVYAHTLGGSGRDNATAIALDAAANVVLAGTSTSADFPTSSGAFQQNLRGGQNAFVARLDSVGNVLTSTYLGGSGVDIPSSVALDGAGNIDVAGSTTSVDFPTTPGSMQPTGVVPLWNNSAPGGFIAQVRADGQALNWGSYVMTSDSPSSQFLSGPGVTNMAVNSAGDIYVSGLTGPGFPVTASAPFVCFQGSNNRTNGFLAHLSSSGVLLDATYLGDNASQDIAFAGGMLPLPDNSVLVAWEVGAVGAANVSTVRFGTGGWTAPACLSSDVLNSATQVGYFGVAPGQLVTLTGFGIGPDDGVAFQPAARGNVPTQLAGVQVLFDGAPAPLLYVQSRQINAIAPANFNGSSSSVAVSYNNRSLQPASAQVVAGNPGIFRLQTTQGEQAAAINQDGTLNGPASPAPRGSVVSMWGTGFGQTSPDCVIGGYNQPNAAPLKAAVVMITRRDAVPEQSSAPQYAGSAPGMVCGVTQINYQVPADAAPGRFSFEYRIGVASGNTATTYESPIDAAITVK